MTTNVCIKGKSEEVFIELKTKLMIARSKEKGNKISIAYEHILDAITNAYQILLNSKSEQYISEYVLHNKDILKPIFEAKNSKMTLYYNSLKQIWDQFPDLKTTPFTGSEEQLKKLIEEIQFSNVK